MILTAVTRYNQVISHYVTATGMDKRVSNEFKVEGNRTLQWLVRFDESEYLITKSTFQHGGDIIMEAESDVTFLRVIDGRFGGERIIYLLERNSREGKYCV